LFPPDPAFRAVDWPLSRISYCSIRRRESQFVHSFRSIKGIPLYGSTDVFQAPSDSVVRMPSSEGELTFHSVHYLPYLLPFEQTVWFVGKSCTPLTTDPSAYRLRPRTLNLQAKNPFQMWSFLMVPSPESAVVAEAESLSASFAQVFLFAELLPGKLTEGQVRPGTINS